MQKYKNQLWGPYLWQKVDFCVKIYAFGDGESKFVF